MRPHLRPVDRLCIFGDNLHLSISLKINKDRWSLEFRLYFLGIENMKQNYIVAMKAERLDDAHNRLRFLVKIGDHDDDAAPVQQRLEMAERLPIVRSRVWLRSLESREESHQLALPC